MLDTLARNKKASDYTSRKFGGLETKFDLRGCFVAGEREPEQGLAHFSGGIAIEEK